MTAYMKPKDRGVYQEAQAQIFSTQQDGRGRLAVPSADPRMKQLYAHQAGAQMDRMLQYGRLGMEKKRMEHEINMGEGRLSLAKGRLDLSKKKFKWDLKQHSKATNIAKFGVALNLAFGIGGFIQNRKLMRKMEDEHDLLMALRRAQLENEEA